MFTSPRLDRLLSGLSLRIGHEVALDGQGRCTLACDGGPDCEIAAGPAGVEICLSSPLVRCDGPDADAVIRRCLELNLDLDATRGCTLALDRHRSSIVVQWRSPVDDLDETRFARKVGGFVAVASELQGRLQARSRPAADEPNRRAPGEAASEDSLLNFFHLRA